MSQRARRVHKERQLASGVALRRVMASEHVSARQIAEQCGVELLTVYGWCQAGVPQSRVAEMNATFRSGSPFIEAHRAMRARLIPGRDLAIQMSRVGITCTELAAAVGLSVSAVTRWRADGVPPARTSQVYEVILHLTSSPP